MGIIVEFSPNRAVVLKNDNTKEILTCEPPNSFDLDILEKIWEGEEDA
jgi:hypothetical protein